jgi:hypothetical protein
MKTTCIAILTATTILGIIQSVRADVIADWTFETSVPSGTGPGSVGPFSAEIGSGNAYAVGLNVISNPAGNGSAHSLSANGWTGSSPYYQFDVSTLGYSSVSVLFDQTSSTTGPADFAFQYSTDGNTFTSFATYSPLVNASPNPVWNGTTSSSAYTVNFDLSSITALDDVSTVDFRLLESGTTSENGGTVASTGTDRVDNFIVNASPVPEPATLALWGIGSAIGALSLRRKR